MSFAGLLQSVRGVREGFPYEGSGIICFFPLPTCSPWSGAPSCTFKASHTTSPGLSFLCDHITFCPSDSLPLPYKDPCNYTRPICIIQDNLPLSRFNYIQITKFNYICKVPFAIYGHTGTGSKDVKILGERGALLR